MPDVGALGIIQGVWGKYNYIEEVISGSIERGQRLSAEGGKSKHNRERVYCAGSIVQKKGRGIYNEAEARLGSTGV